MDRFLIVLVNGVLSQAELITILSKSSTNFQIIEKNETFVILKTENKDELVKLFYNGNSKIETTNTGAVVTGILTATTNAKVGDHIALDHAATGGTVNATHFSGNITGTAATFTTVSIAGTITHEDVTNVDSVGIVTGGLGVRVLAGGIQAVGFYTGLSASGVATLGGNVSVGGRIAFGAGAAKG